MKYIRKANERGKVDFGWLRSAHSFSCGSYYDVNHMGVSALRVINDDIVEPARGFDTHGHKDMEIISYVVSGALEHKDSSGNQYIVPEGDIQIMSAGKGIMHSEYNASKEETVNFLQIWIQPNQKGGAPRYGQKKIEQTETLTPLITSDGRNGTLSILQDAQMSRLILGSGESFSFEPENRVGYLHIVKGSLVTEEGALGPGDAVGVTQEVLAVKADTPVEALWFDLPPVEDAH